MGAVVVQPTEALPNSQSAALYVDLPTEDLYPGDTFTLEIKSLFDRYIDTFELTVDVGAGLRINSGSSPSADGSAVFNGAFRSVSTRVRDVLHRVRTCGHQRRRPTSRAAGPTR